MTRPTARSVALHKAPLPPRLSLLFASVMLVACGGSSSGGEAERPAPAPPSSPELATAPWAGARLPAEAVAPAYLEAWRQAENRDWCTLLAFEDPAVAGDVEAEARTARFGGGWGVAYDLPELRSAFGVAGTGVEPGPDTYDQWPHEREWRDGSRAGYGPEGGSGPKQLAYLEVEGQRCLYNVWSHLGREHLERLLEELRLVRTAG